LGTYGAYAPQRLGRAAGLGNPGLGRGHRTNREKDCPHAIHCRHTRVMPKPPVAKMAPLTTTLFGDTRVDNYFWLRDRTDPDTIPYLEAENVYTRAMMEHTEGLQAQLYAEMLGRIKQTDLTVPVKRDDFFYYFAHGRRKAVRDLLPEARFVGGARGTPAGRKRARRREEIFPYRQLRR
jgi:hypothetical protein